MSQAKGRVGEDTIFLWHAPHPIKPATAPTMLVRMSSGDVAVALSVLHAPVTITGVSDDRRILTASAPVSGAEGAQGEYGRAWLVTESDGPIECRIARVDGSAIHLSSEIQHGIVGDGELQWATWYGTLPAASICAAAARNLLWEVTYTASSGVALPDMPRRDRGTLSVVLQPFDTGLTTEGLLEIFPSLAGQRPRRGSGVIGAIRGARSQLIAYLRSLLLEKGLYEDDVDGPALQVAHAYWAASILLAIDDPERSEALREQADAAVDVELRRFFLDEEQDGSPEQDDATLTGSIPPAAGGSFTPSSSITVGWRSGEDGRRQW